jgi:membrane fusion protein, multidrug efflux system
MSEVTEGGRGAQAQPARAPLPGAGGPFAAPPGAMPPQPPKSRPRWRLPLLVLLLLIIIGTAGYYWYSGLDYESTDDAFIDGNVVQLSPKVAGTVIALNINDNETVHKGDLLLRIDARDYQVIVENAQATLENAQAQASVARANLAYIKASTAATLVQAESGVALAKAALQQSEAQIVVAESEAVRAKLDAARYEKLVQSDIASRQRSEQALASTRSADAQLRAAHDAANSAQAQLGQAQGKLEEAKAGTEQQVAVYEAQVKAADAQVDVAKAQLDQAQLNLSYTNFVAPEDGVITKRNVNLGDELQKDQNISGMVVGKPWVTANFKETQLTHMRPGQPVKVRIDAYPGKPLKAHVASIQRGTGAHFALLPPENATGNYVKVVQRVPVKILFDETPDPNNVLGLGMSVIPTVDIAVTPR